MRSKWRESLTDWSSADLSRSLRAVTRPPERDSAGVYGFRNATVKSSKFSSVLRRNVIIYKTNNRNVRHFTAKP
jgi:hypothetical protein